MAVEVITGHYNGGAEILETFADGTSIRVDEGHVIVQGEDDSGNRRSIAAFAPGQWKFARVAGTKAG